MGYQSQTLVLDQSKKNHFSLRKCKQNKYVMNDVIAESRARRLYRIYNLLGAETKVWFE